MRFSLLSCLLLSFSVIAEDLGGVQDLAPAVPSDTPPVSNVQAVVKNCATVSCHDVAKSASGKYLIKDVGGILVALPLEASSSDEMASVIYDGILPNGKAAGVSAPCDLRKADQPSVKMMKVFESKGLRQLAKKPIPTIITSFSSKALGSRTSTIKFSGDPMCYYQYKK
jgi:hypothetical protein